MEENRLSTKIKEVLEEEPLERSGVDSKVFAVSEFSAVVKAYRNDNPKGNLFKKIQEFAGQELPDEIVNEILVEILKSYYEYTERLRLFLENDPNPLRQKVMLDGIEHGPNYKVESQGGILVKVGGQTVSAGQNFVPGYNVADLYQNKNKANVSEERNSNLLPFGTELFRYFATWHTESAYPSSNGKKERAALVELSGYLTEKLGFKVMLHPMNIKPFLEADGSLTCIITDFAAIIWEFVNSNPELLKSVAKKYLSQRGLKRSQ